MSGNGWLGGGEVIRFVGKVIKFLVEKDNLSKTASDVVSVPEWVEGLAVIAGRGPIFIEKLRNIE